MFFTSHHFDAIFKIVALHWFKEGYCIYVFYFTSFQCKRLRLKFHRNVIKTFFIAVSLNLVIVQSNSLFDVFLKRFGFSSLKIMSQQHLPII